MTHEWDMDCGVDTGQNPEKEKVRQKRKDVPMRHEEENTREE